MSQPVGGPANLEALLEHTREGCLLLRQRTTKGRLPEIVYASGRLMELTGHPREAILGRSIRVLRAASGPHHHFAELLAAAAERRPFVGTIPLRTSSRGDQPFEVRLLPLAQADNFLAVFATPTPAPAGIEGMLERLIGGAEDLAEVVTEALYVLQVEDDLRLRLAWADPRLEALTGYPIAELTAQGGFVTLVISDDLPKLVQRNQALFGGQGGLATYRLRTRSGQVRWVWDKASPVSGPGDNPIRLVVGALADHGESGPTGARARSEQRIAAALGRHFNQLLCLVDDRGVITWAASVPATPFADAIGSLVAKDPNALLSPALADDWLDLVDRVFATREATTGQLDWPLGETTAAIEATITPLDEDRAVASFRPADRSMDRPPQSQLALWPLSALSGLGLPLLMLSPAGRVEEATEAIGSYLRLPVQQLVGRRLVDEMVGTTNRARLEAALDAVIAAPGSFIETALSLDSSRWTMSAPKLQLAAIRRPESGDIHILGLLVESKGRTALRVPAQPAALLLETILESLSDAVLTVDAGGIIEWASGPAERMLARPGESLLGRSVETLFERPEADGPRLAESLLDQWLSSGAPHEARARRANDEPFNVEITGRVLGEGRRRFALVVRDLTPRLHAEETLASLAYHDTLTGLPNRLLFHDRLTLAVERGRRTRQTFAVMLVDLDRFKIVNESLGLERGDHVLKAIAERLALAVRKSDTVARLGGDEFLLLLPGIESAEAVARIAQKLLAALRPPLAIGGHELTTAASIGIALFPYDGDTPEALIRSAETALSRAKEQGRNHFQFYTTDMNASAIERLVLESRLRRALENGEFVVHYQPQASLESGAVVGLEALVRWVDPVLGLVPPGDFIPLAEDTGLIVEIGAWVLRTAAAEMANWQRQLGRPELRLAVNLSGRQFQQADLVDLIQRTLDETALPASCLELEITESVIMREASASVRRLEELTVLGVHLAIDDFGTGYSSLSYLRTFPIRSLKIDRSFIRDIDRDANSATLAQGVVGLGRSLGLKLIAEGVETVRQLQLLKSYGCEEMQGFLLSRPLPAEEALNLLAQERTLDHLTG